jgi:hypothetical protein
VSGSKLESWLSAGVEKFYISLSAGLNPILPAHTVSGTLVATGAITSSGAVTAATSVNAGTDLSAQEDIFAITGDIEVTAGVFRLGAAASRIVPGATSLALRNHANNADNLLVSDAGLVTVRTDAIARRLLTTGATAHDGTEWALSAGWGTTASITSILGNDLRGYIKIASSGTGQGASPTALLTFKNGAFATPVPKYVVCRGSTGNQLTVVALADAPSTTQWSFKFNGTPVAGESYEFFWVGIG